MSILQIRSSEKLGKRYSGPEEVMSPTGSRKKKDEEEEDSR
jgi:hypothetical protein